MAKSSKKKPITNIQNNKQQVTRKVQANTNFKKLNERASNIVEDPAFAEAPVTLGYTNSSELLPLVHWLGGRKQIPTVIQSDFDVIEISQEGITKGAVDDLTVHLGITRKSMAEDIFGMSVKTLERKTPGEKLDKQTSSHALEIAKVIQHAYQVFQDEEKVKRWINKENRALNYMKPVSLFATLTGLNLVNDILGRIEEGVYS